MPFLQEIKQYTEDKEKKETLLEFFRHVGVEMYPKGAMVFREGDTDCEKAYVVVKGKVGVLRKDLNVHKNEHKKEATNKFNLELASADLPSPDKTSRKFMEPKSSGSIFLAKKPSTLIVPVVDYFILGQPFDVGIASKNDRRLCSIFSSANAIFRTSFKGRRHLRRFGS